MQERREIELGAMRNLRQDLGGERQFLAKPSGFDRAEFADGANEMLIDRVVVVHGELHHADDAAEFRDEPAEHAGFVHCRSTISGALRDVRISRNSRFASGSARSFGVDTLQARVTSRVASG